MKDLYIIGAGGFGREVADTVHDINAKAETYRIAGFIDDDETKRGSVINDIEVKGGIDFLLEQSNSSNGVYAVIAIGDPKTKEKIAARLEGAVEWENIIHPAAIISKYASMGVGNIFQAYSLANANVKIGDHCLINARSGTGHDVALGNYVSIMSMCDITGNCRLLDRVYVATNVCIIPGIIISEDAFLGAGSVIVKDVEAGATMIGNPARRVK